MPETSVVIRAFNEEKHLGNLLEAIATQTYQNYEIILVDSGSTDRTLAIAREHPVRIIEIPSRDFTFGYALNVGCKAAKGKYLVFVSAHILPIDRNWLGNLVAGFSDKNVAMIYGRQTGVPQSKFGEKRDFARLFGTTASNSRVPLSYANNANAVVRRKTWRKYPFDEYLFGLEDIDFARKCTKDGLLVRYEPSAAVYHIHEERWPQVFNRYRREAIAAVRIGLTAPPQAGLSWGWFLARLLGDVLATFPNRTRAHLKEILRFRYYQWKGSRVGFAQGKVLTLKTERNALFFPITAQALRHGEDHATIEPLDIPDLKPSEILVKVEYVLLASEGDAAGHAPFSGTIERIGANNRYQERHMLGQRIVGRASTGRAYASHVAVPGASICPVPPGVGMQQAVLVAARYPDISSVEKALMRGEGQDATAASETFPLESYERARERQGEGREVKILLQP